MDILELIKNKKAVRKYKNKSVPKKIINKIIEAGVWGPSILGRQPWLFVIIKNKEIKQKICDLLIKRADTIGVGGNILLRAASRVIDKSKFTIAVYSTGEVVKMASKFKRIHEKNAMLAEPEAIGATIQNMLLVAESEGVGSCWFDMPLVCERYISNLLGVKNKLLAFLTFGYPKEKTKRAKRKSQLEMIKYI